MPQEYDLKVLREDLDRLLAEANIIARRLHDLETRAAKEQQADVPAAPVKIIVQPEPPSPPRTAPPALPVERKQPLPSALSPQQVTPKIIEPTTAEKYISDWFSNATKTFREMGWEVFLGTYGLPRLAIVCISIAVVFFLTLAMERWGHEFLPHLRVGIGYAACVGLLVLAWRLEKKYPEFARVLFGGAFAVMYFVTFATYYIKFARIFPDPAATLLLLALIVVAWAVVAQARQSKVIATLVTVLGHLTILISSLTLDRPAPSSMAGILFLSAGSAFFLLRNRWYYVAVLGMAGSYLNDYVVLAHSHGTNPVVDFWASMAVLIAIFLTFAAAELFAPKELRREQVPAWFRNVFMAINSLIFSVLGTGLVQHFAFTRPHQDLFEMSFAAGLLLIALGYLLLRERDPLYNIFFTKAVTFFTLGLATRYGGSSLSTMLTIETVALLISARESGLLVTRLLALGVAAVTLVQTVHVAMGPPVPYADPAFRSYLVHAAIGVLSFLAASQFYQRTNWTKRSPATLPLSPKTLTTLWQLDIIGEKPAGSDDLKKPLEGLLIPYLFALCAAAVFGCYCHALASFGYRFPVVGILALVLTISAAILRSKPFGFAALVTVLAGSLWVGTAEIASRVEIPVYLPVIGLAALGMIALASETRYIGQRTGLAFHQTKPLPHLLYGLEATLIALLFTLKLTTFNAVIALVSAGIIATVLSLALHPNAMALTETMFTIWAAALFIPHMLPKPGFDFDGWNYLAWGLIAAALIEDRFLAWTKRATAQPHVGAALALISCGTLLCYFEAVVPDSWSGAAFALAGFGYLAYGRMLCAPAATVAAIAAVTVASIRLVSDSLALHALPPGLIEGFVLLALFWVTAERVLKRNVGAVTKRVNGYLGVDFSGQQIAAVPVASSSALLLFMLQRIPHLASLNLTLITMSWFGLALGLFIVAIFLRQSLYRYTALIIIVLTLARVFLIDMKEQDPLLRVAAFAVLGIGLLPISYGYFRWKASLRAQSEDQSKPGD